MKKILVSLSIVMFLFLSCNKEEQKQITPNDTQKSFGAVGNPTTDYFLRKSTTNPGKGHNKGGDTIPVPPPPPPPPSFPTSYEIAMPPVQNQGGEGSCVSFSVGYYARAREEYNKTGVMPLLSPEYLFNQTTTNHTSCSGSAIITACNFLLTNGICTWASYPYSWTNGCTWTPNSSLTLEASKYKITDYLQVNSVDSISVKTALLANHPLIIQVAPDQAFMDAGPSFIWKTQGQLLGYHSLVVVGWDNSKHAYKVINQWGTNWGDAGYTWIDYDFYSQCTLSGIKLVL